MEREAWFMPRENHRLLRRDGCLIEIHPVVDTPTVEIKQDGHLSSVEHDPGYDYEYDLRSAGDAVDWVNEEEVFMFEGSRKFELRAHSSSVAEGRDHFSV